MKLPKFQARRSWLNRGWRLRVFPPSRSEVVQFSDFTVPLAGGAATSFCSLPGRAVRRVSPQSSLPSLRSDPPRGRVKQLRQAASFRKTTTKNARGTLEGEVRSRCLFIRPTRRAVLRFAS